MRYAIRRLRRKLPKVKIFLGCWMADADTSTLRDTAKPDAVATTFRDAVRLSLEAAGKKKNSASSPSNKIDVPNASIDAA